MRIHETVRLRDRISFVIEEALAWFVESGAIGALIALGIMAALMGVGR